jgi:MoaA/NifB/PqqE/SkfB family radical SAM enzyme
LNHPFKAGFAVQTPVFHVTVLSNLPRAYDKYSASYDKAAIPESTYPDQFYVLTRDDLAIGIAKASILLGKLALPGNRLVVLEAEVANEQLHPNLRNGRGSYLAGSRLPVSRIHYINAAGELAETTVEEAMAGALALRLPEMLPYAELRPRSVSVLPIALACQASCRFCFSKASTSSDVLPSSIPLAVMDAWAERAKAAGAERFVITGGGEPGLLAHDTMLQVMRSANRHFRKLVLITNGMHLAKREESTRAAMLQEYAAHGLSVLSVSRHHHDDAVNAGIMGLDTKTPKVLRTWRELPEASRPARLRLICVLQKGGVDSYEALRAYVDWAVEQGVPELCFKELYVSTTLESAYHDNPENTWSRTHQVSLSLVPQFFEDAGFKVVHRLPWGAPVYEGMWNGKKLTVAAYTEPSLYWERVNGVARSWNIMASGQCLVSLEDLQSGLPGTGGAKYFPIQAG